MNKVILMGRLVKDPVVKYTQTGKVVTTATLAVNRPYQKDKQQEADFINIVFWGKPAEMAGNHFAKGERMLVEGRLQIRSYDKDGSKVWVSEVVSNEFPQFIETKKSKNDNSDFGAMGSTVPFDDEIPF